MTKEQVEMCGAMSENFREILKESGMFSLKADSIAMNERLKLLEKRVSDLEARPQVVTYPYPYPYPAPAPNPYPWTYPTITCHNSPEVKL